MQKKNKLKPVLEGYNRSSKSHHSRPFGCVLAFCLEAAPSNFRNFVIIDMCKLLLYGKNLMVGMLKLCSMPYGNQVTFREKGFRVKVDDQVSNSALDNISLLSRAVPRAVSDNERYYLTLEDSILPISLELVCFTLTEYRRAQIRIQMPIYTTVLNYSQNTVDFLLIHVLLQLPLTNYSITCPSILALRVFEEHPERQLGSKEKRGYFAYR